MKNVNEQGRELMATIETLLANREYERVIELCESVQLEGEPPRKFWFCKARALDELGDTLRAIEAYRCEIALVARVPPVLLGRVGVLLSKLGRYRESAICLAASCRPNPSPDLLILLASAFYRLGQTGKAIATVRAAINIDPANDEAWHNLGAYLLDDGPDEAEKAFRHALEISPDRVDTYGGLGMLYVDQRRFDEAMESARMGLDIQPLDGVCHVVIGDAMEGLGDLPGSERAFSNAFRCDGDKPSALLGLARVLARQGKPSEAMTWYGRGLRAWPDNATIRIACSAFVRQYPSNDPKIKDLCELLDQIQQEVDRLYLEVS